MASISLYSIGSIPIWRTDGQPPAQNPLTHSWTGDAFSWQNPSNVGMTFGQPNATLNFQDSDAILNANPLNGDLITDQKLLGDNTIDGRTYSESPNDLLWQSPAGAYVRAEYSVTLFDAAGTGYEMTGVSVVRGYDVQVVGTIFPNGAPPEGTTLYYIQGRSSFDPSPEVPLNVICFASGTMIRTADGEIAVEDLRPGMLVQTRDDGLQPVLWVGLRRLDSVDLMSAPNLRPIRIGKGALGSDTPARDLIVSPQHRILLRSRIAQRMFDAPEILVPARNLLGVDGIAVAHDLQEVTYVHFLLPEHQIVYAEGAESESLFTGTQALAALGKSARREIEAILPSAFAAGQCGETARPLVPGSKARKLVERHRKNLLPLLD